MLQSLRILVHVYMQASSWNSVKVVMNADPRGSASGEMPVANSKFSIFMKNENFYHFLFKLDGHAGSKSQ